MSERRAIAKKAAQNVDGLWRIDGVPGWVCNTKSLIFMGEDVAMSYPERADVDGVKTDERTVKAILDIVKRLDDSSGVAVNEKRDLRIEYVKGDLVECRDCNGEGETDSTYCDCPHCTGFHECESCGGEGKTGTVREDDGQIVFDGAHARGDDLFVPGRFSAVLEHSTVKWDQELEGFLAYDENGIGFAVVMRSTGKAREKSEQAA